VHARKIRTVPIVMRHAGRGGVRKRYVKLRRGGARQKPDKVGIDGESHESWARWSEP
jgi:hypothetical protein